MELSGKTYRVLAVDDEELVRQYLSIFFDRRGDEFTIASCGEEALEFARKQDFDILLTDLYMPVMDGLELIRRCREIRPEMVSIILTGLGTTDDSIAAIKQGVYDYVQKPVEDPSALSRVIERAGARSQLVRERNQLMRDLQRQNERLETNLRNLNDAYDKLMRQEEALEADLKQAQRMQQSLLPSGFPQVEGFDFFGFYRPCDRLGGDFFDVIPLEPGRVAVYLADVAGHGVRAAMVTVIVRELIHAETMLRPELEVFSDPSKALAFLNRGLLEEDLDAPLHVTMGYAVLDGRSGEVAYASAGHPRPFLVGPGGSCETWRADGPALGMDGEARFETIQQKMKMDQSLILFSDGMFEALNERGEEMTTRRLEETAVAAADRKPRHIGDALEKALRKHLGAAPPADDATFVIIRRSTRADTEEGALVPRSVRIVQPKSTPAPLPAKPSMIEVGQERDVCLIRFGERATWQEGSVFCRAIRKAREEGNCARVYLDLSRCQSLDSAMLGLLYQHHEALTVCGAGEKIIRSFRELGILPRLTLQESAPDIETQPLENGGEDDAERRRLILEAHETLAGVNKSNAARFGPVVQLMREDQGE